MGLSEQSAYLLVSVHGCKSLPDVQLSITLGNGALPPELKQPL